jgi:hypothetical protein
MVARRALKKDHRVVSYNRGHKNYYKLRDSSTKSSVIRIKDNWGARQLTDKALSKVMKTQLAKLKRQMEMDNNVLE